MKHLIKFSFFEGIFRILIVTNILLFSYFLLSFFKLENQRFFNFYFSLITLPLIGFYLLYFERKLVIEDLHDKLKRLSLHDFFIENTEIVSIGILTVVFCFGLTFVHSKSFPFYHSLPIAALGIFLGSSIRSLMHNMKIGFLLNKDEKKYLFYFAAILLLIIFLSVSLTMFSTMFLTGIIIGIPIGITWVSVKYFRRNFKENQIFFASQDLFLIKHLEDPNLESFFLEPLVKYMKGNINSCVRKLDKIEKSKKLGKNQVLFIDLRRFRCYICKKDEPKTLHLLSKFEKEIEDIQLLNYQRYLLDINLNKRRQILRALNTLSSSGQGAQTFMSEIELNKAYVLNKLGRYRDSITVSENLIGKKDTINSIIFVYALNNFCYSTAREILTNSGYFNILDKDGNKGSNFNKDEFFSYKIEDLEKLKRSITYINTAFTFTQIIKDHRHGIPEHDAFNGIILLLKETKSLVEFTIGNFDVALSTIRENVLRNN